jgi:lipopolysaccharide transport system ATP-binding protein
MNNDVVISVENLWKQYRYGVLSHRALYKDLQSGWARFRGREDPNLPVSGVAQFDSSSDSADHFWAIQDINFDVKQGEVLGIIGKNGAGKSTLLKIMSRVTTPTRGQIKIKGRVASLLEVGTGFHPELTGRENIFLNGAILGMTKDEIKKKFDEIVGFAEIEKFIDTPVKRYSSGMYVRLAFAVAAHLDTDIMVVDEVLAVGDATFQRKCFGKMNDVASRGRTVLFVSHNMSAINRLCTRALYLRKGGLAGDGPVEPIVEGYISDGLDKSGAWHAFSDPLASHLNYLISARLLNGKGEASSVVTFDEGCFVEVTYRAPCADDNFVVAIKITNGKGEDVFASWDRDSIKGRRTLPGNVYVERCRIPGYLLRPGVYWVASMVETMRHSRREKLETGNLSFEVSDIGFEFEKTRWGVVTPLLQWNLIQ